MQMNTAEHANRAVFRCGVGHTRFYGAIKATGSLQALCPAAPTAATRCQYLRPLTIVFIEASRLVD